MSLILTPAQFIKQSNVRIANFDVKKSIAKFEENGKNFLALGSFKADKATIKTMLKGELTTDGISSTEFNRIPSYSIGIRLDSEEDLEAFEGFTNHLSTILSDSGNEDWDLTNFVKDDKLYIKLKVVDKKRFAILSNVKLDPKKLGDSGIYRGQKVSVFGELGVYCHLVDKKAGITFNARKIVFEEESIE
jgi:hypothetical protein